MELEHSKYVKARNESKYLGGAEFSLNQFFSTGIRCLYAASGNFHKNVRTDGEFVF